MFTLALDVLVAIAVCGVIVLATLGIAKVARKWGQ